MKGIIFIYTLTALGVVGGLVQPLIALFVYVTFATLRPQDMWSFAGDMAGISRFVAVALLAGWATHKFGDRRFNGVRAIVAALVLFAFWTTLSSLQAINVDRSWTWTLELLKIVLPFLAGVTLLTSDRSVRGMLWVIVISHAYISWEMNLSYYLDGYNRLREAGYGGLDNNSFGISLVAALGPAAALGFGAKNYVAKGVAYVSAVLILHAVILTYSRGAILSLMAIAVVAVALIPKKPTYLALTLVGILLGVRLAGPEVVERFQTSFAEGEERDASAQSRVDLWAACFKVAVANPFFGVGPRNFPLVAKDYGFTANKEAHSTWMQTLAEQGFPGLGFLLTFYGAAIVGMWPLARAKWTRDNQAEAAIALAVLMSMAGFLVGAAFVTSTGLETPYYIVMVGTALVRNARVAATAVVPGAVAPAGPPIIRTAQTSDTVPPPARGPRSTPRFRFGA